MVCKACGFEFVESLPLCPRCAEPWENNEAEVYVMNEAEDSAGILDAAYEKLSGIASTVRKYAGEAGESLGDMAGRFEKKLGESDSFVQIKKRFATPKIMVIAGSVLVALMLLVVLFASSGGDAPGSIAARGIRGNISAADGKTTYIFNIISYKKGDKNTLCILTQGSSKIQELDVPIIADVKFGVFVYGDKIYYKDATEDVPENPYLVYDLKTKKNYVIFDEGEDIVSFTIDGAGLYANKADGSFIMLPHGK